MIEIRDMNHSGSAAELTTIPRRSEGRAGSERGASRSNRTDAISDERRPERSNTAAERTERSDAAIAKEAA